MPDSSDEPKCPLCGVSPISLGHGEPAGCPQCGLVFRHWPRIARLVEAAAILESMSMTDVDCQGACNNDVGSWTGVLVNTTKGETIFDLGRRIATWKEQGKRDGHDGQ